MGWCRIVGVLLDQPIDKSEHLLHANPLLRLLGVVREQLIANTSQGLFQLPERNKVWADPKIGAVANRNPRRCTLAVVLGQRPPNASAPLLVRPMLEQGAASCRSGV
jgi:hypothetical protein